MPIKHIKLKLRTRGRGENVILCVHFVSSFPFLYFLFFSLFLSHFLSRLISLFHVLSQNMMKLSFSTCISSQLALSHIFTSSFFFSVWSRLASILYPVANMPLLLFLFFSSWFVSFSVSSCFILSQLVSFLIVSCLSFFFSWLILIHFNTFSRLVLSVLWSHFNCIFYAFRCFLIWSETCFFFFHLSCLGLSHFV